MTRSCDVCGGKGRERVMKDRYRHLHELSKGDGFVLEIGGRKLVGRVRELRYSNVTVAVSESAGAEQVEFETRSGEHVAFEGSARKEKAFAPSTQVVPLGARFHV